jgi:MFS family permease
MVDNNTMNFQAYLVNTFRAIKEEPVIFIIGGLLVHLLTMISMGLLAGPLIGGYFLLFILYLRDNRKPTFNNIFSGLQHFSNLFPYFLVLLLVFLGFMLLILPGLLFATWWIYVLPLMADKKIPFNEAMRLSMNKVNEAGFLMHFVFLLLISVIPFLLIDMLSAILPFLLVLKFLLPPFQAGCLAGLYIDQFSRPAASSIPPHGNEPVSENAEISPSAPEEVAVGHTAATEKNKVANGETPQPPEHEDKTAGVSDVLEKDGEHNSP